MAERTPDSPELAVDEVRRKARRRLVGAVVLALAAAVVLPLLLEKEPRPLGDEVSIRIPPVDDGRFVNRLSPKGAEVGTKGSSAPAQDPKPAAPPAAAMPTPAAPAAESPPTARKSVVEAEQRVLTPATKPAVATPAPAAATVPAAVSTAAPPPAPAAATTPATQAGDVAARLEAHAAPAKPAATRPPADSSASAAAANDARLPAREGFVVQLAAFSDDKGAKSLAGKLRKAGYDAYVEPVETSHGTLWRVRVGGYATRADADAARAKLKSEGHAGIVAPATKRAT